MLFIETIESWFSDVSIDLDFLFPLSFTNPQNKKKCIVVSAVNFVTLTFLVTSISFFHLLWSALNSLKKVCMNDQKAKKWQINF